MILNPKREKYFDFKSQNLSSLLTLDSPFPQVSHHRHWQSALRKISGMKIYTLPFQLPETGSMLGGMLELHGKHISLACFHGINFKSKSWALFSLKDPSISFVSDAQVGKYITQFLKVYGSKFETQFTNTLSHIIFNSI